jgi:hypothetical protein
VTVSVVVKFQILFTQQECFAGDEACVSCEVTGAQGAWKLPLTTGSYVILPENSVSQMDKDFVVKDGLLVPGTPAWPQIH